MGARRGPNGVQSPACRCSRPLGGPASGRGMRHLMEESEATGFGGRPGVSLGSAVGWCLTGPPSVLWTGLLCGLLPKSYPVSPAGSPPSVCCNPWHFPQMLVLCRLVRSPPWAIAPWGPGRAGPPRVLEARTPHDMERGCGISCSQPSGPLLPPLGAPCAAARLAWTLAGGRGWGQARVMGRGWGTPSKLRGHLQVSAEPWQRAPPLSGP